MTQAVTNTSTVMDSANILRVC